MALDLKYRPRKFSGVLGNKAVVQLLHQLSRTGKLGDRSLMFGGPKGCGKTSLARIVACSVVCTDLNDGEPCGACEACLGVRQENAESFEEFDAATQGSVEHMRSIVSDLDYGNLSGKPSVIILDEAQRLTKQAQDALLKSVENRRLLIILSTTEPHKIQGPLRSRLTEFPVSAPASEELVVFLRDMCGKEGITASDEALQLIMQAQDNCPRTCITSIELLSAVGAINVDSVKSHFRLGAIEQLIKALENLVADPRSALYVITELLNTEGASWVRDNTILAITSAVRASVGAKPALSVPGTLYSTRGPAWLSMAKSLASIDKPNAADVEAILLEAIPNLPPAEVVPMAVRRGIVYDPPPSPVVSKPAESPPVVKAPDPPAPVIKSAEVKPAEPVRKIAEPKSKAIEIEGVNFTPSEQLTSVDHKLEKGSRGTAVATGPADTPGVQFDQARLPMTPKEFTRGFIQRTKTGN